MSVKTLALLGLLGLTACAPQGGSVYVPTGYDSGIAQIGPANGISVSGGPAAIGVSSVTQPAGIGRRAPDACGGAQAACGPGSRPANG